MVAIQNHSRRASSVEIRGRFRKIHRLILCSIAGLSLAWIFVAIKLLQQGVEETPKSTNLSSISAPKSTQAEHSVQRNATSTTIRGHNLACPLSKLSILGDLTEEQRNPVVGNRWMVKPPAGGNLHLMCCDTTKGSFHVLLHEKWAPIGVPHLLQMLEGGYFEAEIPLFRCTDACQFGLSSNTTLTKRFGKRIPDDPLWLPTGPDNRFSKGPNPIKRYPKGVLTHAGGGKNSRGVQFVLTLKPNKFMGGGSPWEVPLGEVVEKQDSSSSSGINQNSKNDENNFVDVSLPDIYTGYGEKGPGQRLLQKEGVSDSVREKWPLLDYVLHCSIVDQVIGEGD